MWDHKLYNTEDLSQEGLKARYVYFMRSLIKAAASLQALESLAEDTYKKLSLQSKQEVDESE